jgi:hypothetical protein
VSRAVLVGLAVFVLLFTLPLFGQSPSDTLIVTVNVGKSGLDPEAVRQEIAKELRVSVSSTPVAGAKGKLDVRVDDANVSMTYETADGRQLTRVVKRPKDPSEDLEVIALLAGNLARDEAADLLGGMGPKPDADAGTSPATSETGTPPVDAPPKPKTEPKKAIAKPKPNEKPTDERTQKKSAKKLRHDYLNLSLFHPTALHPDSHLYEFNVELGLGYSRIGALDGFGLTVGALHVDGKAEGIGVSVLWTQTKGGADGFYGTGFFTTSEGRLHGMEGSGIFNHRLGDVRGLQGAGIFNRANNVEGMQGAGILNISGSVDGLQASGIVNQAKGRIRGVQASTINTSGDVEGVQAGLVNVGGKIQGVSVGLVNYSDKVEGLSLAPISILPNNRTQALVFTDSVAVGNIGVKYDTGPMYSLFTLGGDPAPADQRKVGGGGAIGVHVLKEGHLFVDADLLYRYFDEDPGASDEGSHSTALRGLVGWDFGDFGVYLGGGGEYRVTPANDHKLQGYGVLGVQLF